MQTISFWSPLDYVTDATLRCVAGSHHWTKPVLPVRWLSENDFYADRDAYLPVPAPDNKGMKIIKWEIQPGDAVAFNFKTLHGPLEIIRHCDNGHFQCDWLGMMHVSGAPRAYVVTLSRSEHEAWAKISRGLVSNDL